MRWYCAAEFRFSLSLLPVFYSLDANLYGGRGRHRRKDIHLPTSLVEPLAKKDQKSAGKKKNTTERIE